jgi:hypothetical protein
MWFVHWFAGIGFYLAVTVAVWIEGTGLFGEIALFALRLPADW